MSVLEAFVYLAELGGMLVNSFNDLHGSQGECYTYLAFTIRGFTRKGDTRPSKEPGVEDGEQIPTSDKAYLEGAVSRAVTLRIPADHTTGVNKSEAEMLDMSDATEGELLLDDDARRTAVRVCGNAGAYEMTVEPVPGWEPNAWWDIDPKNPAAVKEAKARAEPETGTEWERRHKTGASNADNLQYAKVGRYWVLNEDGAFVAATYKRDYGPWSSEDDWLPYDFHTKGGVKDLEKRGGKGWSTRRRRFLAPWAVAASEPLEGDGEHLGVFLELSFSEGKADSWFRHRAIAADIEADRCAVTISSKDLRDVICDIPGYEAYDVDFVSAFIEGKLRIRVSAAIEGDDQTYGCSRDVPPRGWQLPWAEHIDRSGRYGRELRFRSNNKLRSIFELDWPLDRDDSEQADGLARRLAGEAQIRRASAQVTIPYLLEPGDGKAWETFAVGDEVHWIQTGNSRTRMKLASGEPKQERAPRIVGVAYRWSREPQEASTTLQLEDEVYGPDDLVAPPLEEDQA